MTVLAGNVSQLCATPHEMYAPVTPPTAQVPSSVVHEPGYGTIDVATGDVYWAEDIALRVMVRRASGAVYRIAGSGAFGAAVVDAPALNSPFTYPQGVAFDPSDGSVIMIDAPTSILRILRNGTLVAIARLAFVDYYNAGTSVDGVFASASASILAFLSLSADGRVLYTTDTAATAAVSQATSSLTWSVVRAINLTAGTITRVAGTYNTRDRVTADGSAPLDTYFARAVAARPYLGGNLLVLDTGSGLLRSVVLHPSETAFCPAGYSCPCGTPIPCTSPAAYCPADTVLPRNATRGFYTVAIEALTATASGIAATNIYGASAACPTGAYCVDGEAFLCLPGTFGVAGMQASSAGCEQCPAGTYSPASGSASSKKCNPCPGGTFADAPASSFCTFCPLGTFSAVVGANSSAVCAPCAIASLANTSSAASTTKTALPGSTSCIPLKTARTAFTSLTVTLEDVVTPEVPNIPDILFVTICIPLAAAALIPAIFLWLRNSILAGDWTKSGRLSDSRRKCMLRCALPRVRARQCLRSLDLYGLRHWIDDGVTPVKRQTSAGGATAIVAMGCIFCLSAVLITQYRLKNTLQTTSLLPATLSALEQFAPYDTRLLPPGLSSIAPPTLLGGLEIRISTMGPACNATLGVAAHQLISGDFVSSVVSADHATESYTHLFSCPLCAFGPMSSLAVTFNADCQSFSVTANAVGATGTSYVANTVVTRPDAVVASRSSLALTRVNIALEPQLEVYSDRFANVVQRGYSVVVAGVDPTVGVPMAVPILLEFSLATSSVYVFTEVVRVLTLTQLASSIIGLLGLVSGFGAVLALMEWIVRECSARRDKIARWGSFIRSGKRLQGSGASPVGSLPTSVEEAAPAPNAFGDRCSSNDTPCVMPLSADDIAPTLVVVDAVPPISSVGAPPPEVYDTEVTAIDSDSEVDTG